MSKVEAYRVQERSVQSLNAALLSMGRTASGLSANLQGLAAQIQREGIIGDEAIIKGQAFLATYGQISNDMMPRVTRVMADLAAKMGGDTVTAANKLGKAAMGMVGELREVGITVSDAAAHPFGDEDRNIPAHVSHETCARPQPPPPPQFHV